MKKPSKVIFGETAEKHGYALVPNVNKAFMEYQKVVGNLTYSVLHRIDLGSACIRVNTKHVKLVSEKISDQDERAFALTEYFIKTMTSVDC